jgi:hypothetical protein
MRAQVTMILATDESPAETADRVRMFLETHPVLGKGIESVTGAGLPDAAKREIGASEPATSPSKTEKTRPASS